MAFVSCFSTANTDVNHSPIVKFTPRSKICFVMVLAPTNSFKTVTTRWCFFFSKLFLAVAVSASSMAVSGAAKGVAISEEGTRFSLTYSHSPNRTFLEAAYSFSFSMRQRNIRLTDSFAGFLAG